MKLTFSPISICRTPVFSLHQDMKKAWTELKSYIQESSPEFFDLIKDYNEESLLNLDPKIRFTIWKYFNRAKYRATPFGHFAAFSLIPVSKENQSDPVVLSRKTITHRFPNWQEKENLNLSPQYLSTNANFVRTNTTGYLCDQELRYVNIENASFELSAVQVVQTTLKTLKFCHIKRTLQELCHFLHAELGLKKSLASYFIQQLIESQLLLSDFQPNITGTDYFKRIGYPKAEKNNDYIIAERKILDGCISQKDIHIIPELIEFLCRHLSPNKNAALNHCRSQFSRRFEDKVIPLLVAMDPEMGVGYESLTQDSSEDMLVQELKAQRQQTNKVIRSIDYPAIYQFILNGMLQQKTVQLEDFKDEGIGNTEKVANTFSLMLQYSGELLVVSQIGGCTANSLLGRFSMASDEVTGIGQRLAQTEQDANPDVLFFDIAYQLEKNADNINRRKSIYSYELPILSWTESAEAIDLDDLLLSVKNNEFVLHSAKYQKRVVPKLASAYNYARSDLSVFRFLSDLQHQNLRSSLNINVLNMFPGLSHYQRIQYKYIVLSPEKWLVPKQICNGTDKTGTMKVLTQWLSDIRLTAPFKCGFADQTLTFNPTLEEDRHAFLLFCKNKTDFYIEEAFITDKQLVTDENQAPYISEFIINLEHNEQIYTAFPFAPPIDTAVYTSAYLPGEEWLYFEIYCHPSNSTSLLLAIHTHYLRHIKKKIKNWFFIRYMDPSYHIRLRIQLKEKSYTGDLIAGLSRLLRPYTEQGTVADLQLKTYRPELERYGKERIYLVEKCFGNNSTFVLHLLSKPFTVHLLYYISIILMENIMQGIGFSIQEQLKFAEKMAGAFSAEMKISIEGFKKVNKAYKDFTVETATDNGKIPEKKMEATQKCFLQVLETSNGAEKDKLLSDLFHMHTNRLFNNDQRMHEMVMYLYLIKRIKTRIGRLQQDR